MATFDCYIDIPLKSEIYDTHHPAVTNLNDKNASGHNRPGQEKERHGGLRDCRLHLVLSQLYSLPSNQLKLVAFF